MEALRRKTDYQLARELIVKHILAESYQVGDKLPSRGKLTELLGVGLISVQQAMKALEGDGVLRNLPRSGCYLKAIPPADTPGQTPRSPFDAEMLFGHPSPADGKLTLRFAIFPGELADFGDAWKRVIADFERKAHGVSVETVPTGSMEELQEGLRRAEIDVFQLPLSQLPLMVKSGLVLQPGKELALNADSFFKPIYEASRVDGVPWGVPLAVGCCCMFHGRKWEGLVHAATEGGGFWNLLERLEATTLPDGLEAFIANNHGVNELFRLASPSAQAGDMDTGACVDSPDFPGFVMRLDKHYRNPKIFHPAVKEGCEDAMRNLAAGRSAMAFGNSSWLQVLRRLGVSGLDLGEEPHEEGLGRKANATLHACSSLTCHPDECLAFLNHLGSLEAQRLFAWRGVCVANKEACQDARLELPPASTTRLMSMLDASWVPAWSGEDSSGLLERALRMEAARWRSGKLTAPQFLEAVRRKQEIFKNRPSSIANNRRAA